MRSYKNDNNTLFKVEKYIEKFNMISKGNSVIVGVSGGADSVCLISILAKLREKLEFNINAVHIHHGIRGEEADRDMHFVEELCEKMEVRLEKYHYNVPQYAKENNLSEEEAGRILRYQTFRKVGEEQNCEYKIAVAHNINDNVETFIHNLCRGTSLKGLVGINPVNDNIIRPVKCLTRQEIEDYVNSHSLTYITDSTNLVTEYTRNRIRLDVIPYLSENINHGVIRHIEEVSQDISEAENYIQNKAEEAYNKAASCKDNRIMLNVEMFSKQDMIIKKRIIRKAIELKTHKLKDITRQHVESILELFDKNVGRYVNLPYNLCVKREYTSVVFYDRIPLGKEVDINNTESVYFVDIKTNGEYLLPCDNKHVYTVEILDVEKDNININFLENSLKNGEKIYTKWLDYDKIKFTVQLRFRNSGDFIVVRQDGSRKKLKDYFIDSKIPADERSTIPLLANGNDIMWIVGHRISEKYKITSQTQHILKIERKDKKDEG